MNLRKKECSSKIFKISESSSDSKGFLRSERSQGFQTSSRFTNNNINSTESNLKRIETRELEDLIKLRNNVKKKLLICKDDKSERLLNQCFNKISKRIKTIDYNQMMSSSTQFPFNDTNLLCSSNRNKQNNELDQNSTINSCIIDSENEDPKIEENDSQKLLYKQIIQMEKINKEIKNMDMEPTADFAKELPRYFFLRENVLLKKKPLSKTNCENKRNSTKNKYLNLIVNPFKNNNNGLNSSGKLFGKTQENKSHKLLFNGTLRKSITKRNTLNKKKVSLNRQLTFRNNETFRQRPSTANSTSISSQLRMNQLKTFEMATEASEIISNMKIIKDSIHNQYYNMHHLDKIDNYNDYDNNLLSLYKKKEEIEQNDLLKTKAKNIKNKKEINNTMEKEMIATLRSIPSTAKSAFRETFKTILSEHRLLNKPTEYQPNPVEQKKLMLKLKKKFNMSTKRKLHMLRDQEFEQLNGSAKDTKHINIDKLEWLLIKRRVLKPEKRKNVFNLHQTE